MIIDPVFLAQNDGFPFTPILDSVGSLKTVYLDYNATTQLDPEVRNAMEPYLREIWGNPSSVHHLGVKARAHLDDFRDRAARVLHGKPSEIVFTSGGTEANNLAVFGTARMLRNKGRHLITSTIEHHAVLHCFDYLERKEGFSVTRLPVDAEGRVSVDDLSNAIQADTTLVSIMAANNETGTIQPVSEFGELCRGRGVLFHTDAVQWFGKLPFNDISAFNADLVSLCGHKFHGPRGAGLLYIRSPLLPDPVMFGGAHENERRAGTENLSAIAGLVEAMERFMPQPVFSPAVLQPMGTRILQLAHALEGVHFRGSRNARLPNTVAMTVEDADSIVLLAGLDLEGICASSGSACSAGSLEPSHVMRAMGVNPKESNALIRFSIGRDTTVADIDHLEAVLPKVINRVRSGVGIAPA